ncbi:hypothetical protein [Sebaldella sp. S0638]|uniref:hypothetical protein n=1 Tax=Sebaldella sp. S0638 TaxID=2957809 RepID=UPI00209EFD3D|nr:hypothetical protein [Sebaldella sp. S0638]MCP1225157.1 hypothetical protein [Sebaldella sp. S0638]
MLKIYLKSEKRLFLEYEGTITAYTFDNILETVKDIKNKYGIKKKKVSLILDFSKFYISFFEAPDSDAKREQSLLKSFLSDEIEDYNTRNFITKQFYLDHPLRKSLVFCIKKDFISNLVFLLKKYGLVVTECKVDIMGVYKYYENTDISVLTFGDELSSFISIQDKSIQSFKSMNLTIDDKDSVNSYEFVTDNETMTVLDYQPENLEVIFKGCELSDDLNFLKSRTAILKSLKINNIFPYILIIFIYFFLNSFLSTNELEKRNNEMKNEIDTIQQNFLAAKNKNIPDYSKDINELNDIIQNMKYQNHYKFLRFLISESNTDTGFSKIIYDNNFWLIEGDSVKFKNVEKLEIKLGKYAQNIELIFIKSRNKLLTFQYKIGDIIWD